ncbi:MAG: hypothetical protein ACLUW6_03895 [Coriobacteriaceae bacterium]
MNIMRDGAVIRPPRRRQALLEVDRTWRAGHVALAREFIAFAHNPPSSAGSLRSNPFGRSQPL